MGVLEAATSDKIKVYTPDELAGVMKIGKTNAYKLMRASGFPSYKINNRLFVTDKALREWLVKMQGRNFKI